MVRAVLSLFYRLQKDYRERYEEWSIGQKKTCRKKQHVDIYRNKEMPILICGIVAVGEKDKSTRYTDTNS